MPDEAATATEALLARAASGDGAAWGALMKRGAGAVHFSQQAPFTMSPPQILLTLPAGQDEASLSGSASQAVGTGGGGGGTFRLTVIPEPAAGMIVSLALGAVLHRRRR